MKRYKTCCCIGHREIEETKELKKEIYGFMENLIVNENVKTFLFGSRSKFDVLCHSIVTELKEKYPYIKRVGYACKSERFILESVREDFEEMLSKLSGREIYFCGVDEEIRLESVTVSGKAAYIERNQAMIDDSDYSLFYYNKNYVPPQRENGKTSIGKNQPNSGTAIAFRYAKRKRKEIKNFFKD